MKLMRQIIKGCNECEHYLVRPLFEDGVYLADQKYCRIIKKTIIKPNSIHKDCLLPECEEIRNEIIDNDDFVTTMWDDYGGLGVAVRTASKVEDIDCIIIVRKKK